MGMPRPCGPSPLSRRETLAGAAAAVLGPPVWAGDAKAAAAFSELGVRVLARDLARRRYRPPPKLPAALSGLSYSQYRSIRFRKDQAIWRGQGVGLELEMFAPGSVYDGPVRIDVVERGQARQIPFDPALFTWNLAEQGEAAAAGAAFSGFRAHGPLNRPDYLDEFLVFQGASYFRAVAKGQAYGISARGLALKTAQPEGEEFPAFRRFWIERPRSGAESFVVHALLDSPSVTGAYRFGIYPGETTVMEVNAILYPRRELTHVGAAPLTSMFFYGWLDRSKADDFRPEVHDSDGLAILTGTGERLWRPLANPRTLQLSAFVDYNPRGFGLIQRARRFERYEDLEAAYERRPSLWVEPKGDWGAGHVELVEIPTESEVHDNIAAYWRPSNSLKAGQSVELAYTLRWGADVPADPASARVAQSRAGRRGEATRLFVVDYVGGPLQAKAAAALEVRAWSSAGVLSAPVVQPGPHGQGARISFKFEPGDATVAELRLEPRLAGARAGETWLYRWTA